MTGLGLIILLLALVGIVSGVYLAAWCLCSVQRTRKEGHEILESEEDNNSSDPYTTKKFYGGLGES